MILALAAASPALAPAAVLTFERTFNPGEITIDRFGGQFDSQVVDTTRASIAGPTSAGAGDEIHINLRMAPGSALRFQPTADLYFVEAYLFNNGGSVNTVSTSQIAFAGMNIVNPAGELAYETSNIGSWYASKWTPRAQFLSNPSLPGEFTQLNVTFTIPAGYATENFAEVFMNIGAYKSGGGSPPKMFAVVPEPASLGLVMPAVVVMATNSRRGRRRRRAGNARAIPV